MVVVLDGSGGLGPVEFPVGRAAQDHSEGFVRFGLRIAEYGDGDGFFGLARGEGQSAAGGAVVLPGLGGAVCGGVVERHRQGAGRGEGDAESGVGVPLREAQVGDGQEGLVVVANLGHCHESEQFRIHRVGKDQAEGFVRLRQDIPEHGHGDGFFGLAIEEGQGAAGGRVVFPSLGRFVQSGVIHLDFSAAEVLLQAEVKGCFNGSGIALVHAHDLDGNAGDDGARRLGAGSAGADEQRCSERTGDDGGAAAGKRFSVRCWRLTKYAG